MKRGSKEHDLQVACVRWFKYQYSKFNELIWATPNGGSRNPIEGKRLKAEGVLAGVPDLFIAIPKGKYHGLFIEMKVGRNKPTDNQKRVMAGLIKQGFKCVVCYSIEQFITEIKEYFK